MDNLTKLKIYKKNSLYADFLFSYPATYLFHKTLPSQKVDTHQLFGAVRDKKNILYIHIPFCYHICDFCNVYKEKVDYSLIESYLQELFREIDDVSGYIKDITRVYIGGGTPTLLSDEQLNSLLQKIHTSFQLSKDCYIEIDAFPSTLTDKKLSILAANNVAQISIGIQSMEPEVLTNVGRVGQNFKVVEKMISHLQKYNFNLHFDFILGLPGENIVEMKSNIEYIAQNAHPYSVSINSYDNTIDTQLYKRYSTYFKQKQYKEHLRKNMAEMEELLESKYSITRKTTFYFSDFWRKNMNVVALGAGAFGFLNTSGVYRNPLLQEYLDRGYEYKKIIPFVLEDYKVMFLIHNYYLRDINERYNAMFSTDMYDDFSRQIDILEKKGFVKNFGQSNLQFCFGTSSIAYFEFINFYSFNILGYYNIYE